jgi:hypothetical protein
MVGGEMRNENICHACIGGKIFEELSDGLQTSGRRADADYRDEPLSRAGTYSFLSGRWALRVMGCGLWAVGCGLWAVGCGLWAVGCGLWAVGCGLWAVGCGTSEILDTDIFTGSSRTILAN